MKAFGTVYAEEEKVREPQVSGAVGQLHGSVTSLRFAVSGHVLTTNLNQFQIQLQPSLFPAREFWKW